MFFCSKSGITITLRQFLLYRCAVRGVADISTSYCNLPLQHSGVWSKFCAKHQHVQMYFSCFLVPFTLLPFCRKGVTIPVWGFASSCRIYLKLLFQINLDNVPLINFKLMAPNTCCYFNIYRWLKRCFCSLHTLQGFLLYLQWRKFRPLQSSVFTV